LHGLLQWRRILVLLFLALLPLLVVFFFRAFGAQNIRVTPLYQAYLRIEFMTVMVYYSSVVIPITILLFASGIIRDEQENQTLTYLLLSPIPRWALYLSKLLAAFLVAWVLVSVCMAAVMFCIWTGAETSAPHHWVTRWLALLPATAMLIVANGGFFGLISVLLHPSLLVGVVYIALFEVFLANYEFVLRKFTGVHYFQCIVINWIGKQFESPDGYSRSMMSPPWQLANEKIIPETQECVITLLSVFLVTTLLAMYFFTKKEYRLKTPEGN
ncbi:MAG TPA: ABC transporter permease, partial [Gemmatales bacterium]|nr:ABC transporter permease [Gemmatales bacterium]